MVVLLATSHTDEVELWRRLLEKRLPGVELRIYPAIGEPSDIEVALAWKAPHGLLATLPQLRMVCSLGMGVDHLLDDPTLPSGVVIARLVDSNMVEQMSEYALYGVLHFHRRFDVYERFQSEHRWQELPLPHTAARRVGVMGLGEIGADCARKIRSLGFPVSGWSRTPKSLPGIQCHTGKEGLNAFLADVEILLLLLPLTERTAGIIDARALGRMPHGSYLVNLARGGLVVESALLDALERDHLAGALLDVTAVEPLPPDHPLWTHPRVKITPHIAGLTNPLTAIEPIARNIERLMAKQPVTHAVDRERGY
jgi:glyoxylate/hydroxypyruvate reductase A